MGKTWKKNYRKHFLRSFQRTKSTQTGRPVFAETIEHFNKTKYELELVENIDFFLDGYGSYSNNSEAFETESL